MEYSLNKNFFLKNKKNITCFGFSYDIDHIDANFSKIIISEIYFRLNNIKLTFLISHIILEFPLAQEFFFIMDEDMVKFFFNKNELINLKEIKINNTLNISFVDNISDFNDILFYHYQTISSFDLSKIDL